MAIGASALRRNSNRGNLVAIGDSALYNNANGLGLPGGKIPLPEGYYNTAVGSRSLYSNISGYSNTALGYLSLYTNLASNNTAVGQNAAWQTSTGGSNTAVGSSALWANTAGVDNTAVGSGTLYQNSSGAGNTAIGSNAGPNAATRSNTTALGFGATCTTGNSARVGNSAVTSIGGYAGWTTLPSDARFKTNVVTDVKGLDFIMRLRPVTYNVKVHELASYLGEDQRMDANGNVSATTPSPEIMAARNAKATERYTGFIAQKSMQRHRRGIRFQWSGQSEGQ